MKILIDGRVLTHKIYTGVENYTLNILKNIKTDLEVKILKPKTNNKYLSHFWTHFILPFKKGDIMFCPANISPIFIPKNKKVIVTIHDVIFLTHPKSFSKFFRIYYKIIMPYIIRRADKIITVSNYSKLDIEKYYPNSKGKIEVIYNGFENKFMKIDNIEKKNQILYVGSINERKNFIGVIKSFELLKQKDLKLLIIGNFLSNFEIDEDSKKIILDAKNNPNIIFKNNVKNYELIKIYNESKLFLFPSFYEGFGLPVLEAMACGTPVVCSNTTSLPEVGSDAVIYCNPTDIEDIKNKIELVLGNKQLQNKLIQKGLKRVKKFSWEESAKKHLKIFKEYEK